MEDKSILAGIAIICATVLEIFAISRGYNDTTLTGTLAILAGVAGSVIGIKIGTKQK